MSQDNRNNMEKARRQLRSAEQYLTDAGALTSADKGLQRRIETLRQGVSKEADELATKLNPKQG